MLLILCLFASQVLRLSGEMEVNKGKRKQDAVVGDSSGSVRQSVRFEKEREQRSYKAKQPAKLSKATMSRKRPAPVCDEFEDVAAIVRTSPNAKVHGVVTRLSPMKPARRCSYYQGDLCDGRSKVHLPPLSLRQ